eukprot:Plantae.Rhodophyta-Palmaria_palmata.ctg1239.p1 GENE.Plantae.Rhodophyta-Palmaria_palmata.ctg1239~~Plantae.Rhodophyta-Palmaria_palmata.ctg1239.p1  ORF type:complete len:155 (+),score=11.57 Plantae.Rhodophyta-Palmaria_palmata.ctg1239:1309-1773(+)
MSPHACSKVGENKDAAAIDVTVVGASDYAPLAQTTKDAATRSEETKASEWTTRVADVNALLSLDGAPVWVPPFEFRPFGLDTHGALGKEAIAIIRQFAEKRADRSPMSVGLCKRIALEGLSITLHSANARMIRTRRPIRTPHEMLPPSDSLGAG